MPSDITNPAAHSDAISVDTTDTSPKGKGKGKVSDEPMNVGDEEGEEEEEEDDDDDDYGDEDGEGEDEEDEEDLNDIDPSSIVGRRTRGVRIDYASKEAMEKAGLSHADLEEEEDEDVKMD